MNSRGLSQNTNDHRPLLAITAASEEEVLVVDSRAGLTPAQVVERKLVALLNSTPLPMSQMETTVPRRPVH
jgi:hypothetical protein